MIFYEIEMLSVPEIKFACSVDLEKYKVHFDKVEYLLEISVCEKGRILVEYEDGTKEIKYPGMLLPMFDNVTCTTSAYKNERQQHTTVGVNLRYHSKRYESEQECDISALIKRMKEKFIILIPSGCYMENEYNKVISKIRNIISLSSSPAPSARINAVAQWYVLAGMLTDFVLDKLNRSQSQNSPAEVLYADKAVQYICTHYRDKLTVGNIAGYLGISEGYLHRIFRDIKGRGVLEYINQYRIFVAIELINHKNVSLREAAYHVGIEDPAYMSKLFKKVMGVSYRQFVEHKNNKKTGN